MATKIKHQSKGINFNMRLWGLILILLTNPFIIYFFVYSHWNPLFFVIIMNAIGWVWFLFGITIKFVKKR